MRLPRLAAGEHYFDVTTLALRAAARTRIPGGSRVLEVGTGSFAILALWLARRGCRVECTEIDPEIAERARESTRLNGAALRVTTAAYLGTAPAADFIVFNPPYVRTADGEARGLPVSHRQQWDGGADGTAVLRGFLEDYARRGGEARALVGVNRLHVPRAAALHAGESRPGVRIESVWSRPWLPSDVYCLVRTKSPSASTSSPVE